MPGKANSPLKGEFALFVPFFSILRKISQNWEKILLEPYVPFKKAKIQSKKFFKNDPEK